MASRRQTLPISYLLTEGDFFPTDTEAALKEKTKPQSIRVAVYLFVCACRKGRSNWAGREAGCGGRGAGRRG